MVILEERPITLSEVVSLVEGSDKGKEMKSFIKDFNKMPLEKVLQLKEELESLDLIKLKEFHIVKIVDFMPRDASELNKVVVDVSLDSDEVTKILEIVNKH